MGKPTKYEQYMKELDAVEAKIASIMKRLNAGEEVICDRCGQAVQLHGKAGGPQGYSCPNFCTNYIPNFPIY